MPVPTRVRPEKNIWVAASDGDLERVQVRSMMVSLVYDDGLETVSVHRS